jgi:hypothetical protein
MSKFKSIIEKFLRFAKKIKPCPKQQKLYPLGANNNDENELEPLKPYFSAIDEAIEQKFINVGLVGDYSSGKSTIIENYLKNSKNKHKAIYLSLAKIGDLKINNNDVDETWKKTIQEKILELLFFQAKVTVPNGSFRKVFSFPNRLNWLLPALLAIVSTFFIFQDFNPSNHWFLKEIIGFKDLIFIIVSLLLGFCYYYLMQFLTFLINIDYGKFKLKIAEVQAETELTKMPFHKHLREIIYICQKLTAKKSVLVIVEDLDRFNSLDIFTEIREIAILLNRSLENHKLVFLYALRSQIFVKKSGDGGQNTSNDKDNAVDHVVDIGKFFDVIIPVVKSYNNHTLADKIIKQIEGANKDLPKEDSPLKEKLKEVKKKLEAVANILCETEVVDFRIANNICNHFNIIYQIYQAKSGKDTKYCPAEILALTIYRIFDPKDYDNLHNKCGELYKYFTASPIEDYQKTAIEELMEFEKQGFCHHYFDDGLKELVICDITKESLKKYHELNNINQKLIFKDHPHSINKFIISPSPYSKLAQEIGLNWEVDLNSDSGDSELENEFNKVLNFTRSYSKKYNETKIVPICRDIYKEIKKLKQQDKINKIPPTLLSNVSRQLIVGNYINKDYKKYLFASDEANETAGSSNPPLPGMVAEPTCWRCGAG